MAPPTLLRPNKIAVVVYIKKKKSFQKNNNLVLRSACSMIFSFFFFFPIYYRQLVKKFIVIYKKKKCTKKIYIKFYLLFIICRLFSTSHNSVSNTRLREWRMHGTHRQKVVQLSSDTGNKEGPMIHDERRFYARSASKLTFSTRRKKKATTDKRYLTCKSRWLSCASVLSLLLPVSFLACTTGTYTQLRSEILRRVLHSYDSTININCE